MKLHEFSMQRLQSEWNEWMNIIDENSSFFYQIMQRIKNIFIYSLAMESITAVAAAEAEAEDLMHPTRVFFCALTICILYLDWNWKECTMYN